MRGRGRDGPNTIRLMCKSGDGAVTVIKNHLGLEADRDEGKPEVKSSIWLRDSNLDSDVRE